MLVTATATLTPPTWADWTDSAACLGMDPALFFAEGRGGFDARPAKATCAACPVRDECLEAAIAEELAIVRDPDDDGDGRRPAGHPGRRVIHGIRGGTTAEERYAIHRQRAALR